MVKDAIDMFLVLKHVLEMEAIKIGKLLFSIGYFNLPTHVCVLLCYYGSGAARNLKCALGTSV